MFKLSKMYAFKRKMQMIFIDTLANGCIEEHVYENIEFVDFLDYGAILFRDKEKSYFFDGEKIIEAESISPHTSFKNTYTLVKDGKTILYFEGNEKLVLSYTDINFISPISENSFVVVRRNDYYLYVNGEEIEKMNHREYRKRFRTRKKED